LLFGFIVFMFSEISSVLVVRDQDFREKLVSGKHMTVATGEEYKKLITKENMKMGPRPYLSVIGGLFMFIGTSCLMFPLCDVLTIIGLPSAPCILLITVGSFFATVCNISFLLFLVWSCTRIWASLVFLLIAFTGSLLLPSGNPILLCLWVVIAVGGGYAYFFYLPSTYSDPKEVPPYVQNIGDFTVEANPEKIQNAFKEGFEVAKMEAEEKIQEAERAAQAATEKLKAEAEKAKKMAEEAQAKAAAAVPGSNKPEEKK